MRSIVTVVELVAGYCGFLGLGWILAGKILRGVVLLLGFSTLLAVGAVLSFLSLGCLAFIFVPLYVVAPIISAIKVYEFQS
jgi:hypothetical protein